MRVITEGLVVLTLLALVLFAPFCEARADRPITPDGGLPPRLEQPGKRWCPIVHWEPCAPKREARDREAGCRAPGPKSGAGIAGNTRGDVGVTIRGRTTEGLTLRGRPVCDD